MINLTTHWVVNETLDLWWRDRVVLFLIVFGCCKKKGGTRSKRENLES